MRDLRHLPPGEEQEERSLSQDEAPLTDGTPGAAPRLGRGPVLAVASVAVLIFLEIPLCPAAALLGVPCPGCGLGRASLALLRGHPGAALALHPLFPALLPAVFLFLASLVFPRAVPESLRTAPFVTWVAGALLALMIVVWLARFAGAFGGPVAVAGPLWK